MILDAAIVGFTVIGLTMQNTAHDSPIWIVLYKHGIFYFVASTVINIPTAVGWTVFNITRSMLILWTFRRHFP